MDKKIINVEYIEPNTIEDWMPDGAIKVLEIQFVY